MSTRQILFPGFMPNLGDYDRLNLEEKNKELYDFWLRDKAVRSYCDYVKKCIEVCESIIQTEKDESVYFKLIGHSTGCTVILDPCFAHLINEYKTRITSIELLCPATHILLIDGSSSMRTTLSLNPVTKTVISFLSHVPLSISKNILVSPNLFPDRKVEDSPLSIKMNEFSTFILAYATISETYNKMIWSCDIEVNVVFADNDKLIDNESVKAWLPSTIEPLIVIGDHEAPLYDSTCVKMR